MNQRHHLYYAYRQPEPINKRYTFVYSAIGWMIVGTAVQVYGQQQEGAAKSKMYKDAAYNADVQAQMARDTAATNIMLTKRNMAQNVHATQMDASFQDKNLKDTITKVRGTQAATSAAMGVGGGSVTQADIAQDTLDKEKMDEIAIRYNADIESANITNEGNDRVWGIQTDLNNQVWGLGVQKKQYLAAAKNSKSAANIQSLSTILSSASSVAGIQMKYGTTQRKPISTWSPGKALI